METLFSSMLVQLRKEADFKFAAQLKLKKAVVETALKALAKVKLMKEVKRGVYKCPLAGSRLL